MTHPFEVGKTYRNRVGEYVVMAIDGEQMKIRYLDGKTLQTKVDIQARIWENIQFEERASRAEERRRLAQEARLAARKQTRETRAKFEFGGFQPADFQAKGRGVAWSSRQQLGRLLAYELRRRTKAAYGFWAVPRQSSIYLARKERYAADAQQRNAALFVATSETGLSYGLHVTRPEGEAAPNWPWSVLLTALSDEGQAREALVSALRGQQLSLDLHAMQLEYGLVGRVTLANGGFVWQQESADQQLARQIDWQELLDQLQAVAGQSRSGLYICTRLSPEAAVEAGPDIAPAIVAVFEALVPLYDAATQI